MNWKKIFTIAALTAFSASVATGQGTAPTIVQGDYISNVFGQSNFVKNPNAKLNNANVTVSSATVTRSTTTPLVATSEFNITTSTSTGYADWSTRTFDAGMKNQNCEARFTYRGFSVGSTSVQIRQGSNTVAQLTLTASTDPRIASINFPCGDLSAATTLRVQQATAALTGTNEIGGIYVGLATNQANVAQAEFVGSLRNFNNAGANCIWTGNGGSAIAADLDCSTYQKQGLDMQPSTRVPAITFTAPKSGNYQLSVHAYIGNATTTTPIECQIFSNGSLVQNLGKTYFSTGSNSNETRAFTSFNTELTGGTAYTFDVRCVSTTNILARYFEESLLWTLHRFPTSSELVVTPERQNVYGGVVYTASQQSLFGGSAISSTYTTFNGGQWDDGSLKGKAALTTTGSGQDLGFSIPNMPVGNYKLEVSGLINAGQSSTTVDGYTRCNFRIYETTTTTEVARQVNQDISVTSSSVDETRDYNTNFAGVFSNTSVATRNFVLQANKWSDATAGTVGICQAYSNTGSGTYNTNITFLLTPLDQPSNSALYVEGPVKASATGAAIPAGYVGERKTIHIGSATNVPSSGAWFNVGNMTLTTGIWTCALNGTYEQNGATFTSVGNALFAFSDVAAPTGMVYPYQLQGATSGGIWPTSFVYGSLAIPPMTLISNGSQITWPDGVTRGTTTLHVSGFLSSYTAGTPRYYLRAECTRVN